MQRSLLLPLLVLGYLANVASAGFPWAVSCYVGITSVVPLGSRSSTRLATNIKKAVPHWNTTFSKEPVLTPGFSYCWNYTTRVFAPPAEYGVDEVQVYGGSRWIHNHTCDEAIVEAFHSAALRSLSKFGYPEKAKCCSKSSCNFGNLTAHKSQYTSTQFVAFNINTFPGRGPNNEQIYLGNPNITVDLIARYRIMEQAIQRAEHSSKIDRRSSVLKIFVAPEFFFRGPVGAYNATELSDGTHNFAFGGALAGMVSSPKYADWLFVFGTVIAYDFNRDPARNVSDPASEYVYFNVAPVVKGYSQQKFLAFKNYISTIDFIANRTEYVPDPKKDLAITYYHDLPQVFQDSIASAGFKIVENDMFELDNLTIGIEVCLDHLYSVLEGSLQNSAKNYVDVHIITSAGMSIARGAVAVRQSGATYLVDGNSRSESNLNDFGLGHKLAMTYPSKYWAVGPVDFNTADMVQANYIRMMAGCLNAKSNATLEVCRNLALFSWVGSSGASPPNGQSSSTAALAVIPAVTNTSTIAKYYYMKKYENLGLLYEGLGFPTPPTPAAPTIDVYPVQEIIRVIPLPGIV